ncbi:MAG: response regulator [candidate division Zixibacteria bacterium]|nr:response regulator [candidate division Zixibacteria bacterium]
MTIRKLHIWVTGVDSDRSEQVAVELQRDAATVSSIDVHCEACRVSSVSGADRPSPVCDAVVVSVDQQVRPVDAEIIRAVRGRCGDAAVVVYSAVDDPGVGHQCIQYGADDYVVRSDASSQSLLNRILFITERRHSVSNCREESSSTSREQSLRSVITESTDGMLVIDADGCIAYLNPVAERLFGKSHGRLIDQVLGVPLVADGATEIEIVADNNAPTIAEMNTVDIRWNDTPARLVSFHDITARRQAQDYLQSALDNAECANRKLQELDALKSEFLSTASHELRTPLTVIRAYTALVNDGVTGATTPDQRDCLETVLRNCDRLEKLIGDILNLQKIESGRLRLRRQRVDIVELVRQCAVDFGPTCEQHGLRLDSQLTANLPPVLCDPDKIQQVLINLLSNAVKFTPEGGHIRVGALRPGDESQLVRVDVSDTGRGIAEEDLKHVFGKFTQFHREPSAGAKGTGLGLAIVKSLVEAHGGSIDLDSELDQGSTFSITLPVYSEEREFRAFLEDSLSASLANGVALSVIGISVHPRRSIHLSTDDGQQIYDRISDVILRTVRRSDDAVLSCPGLGMILVVGESDEGDVTPFRNRIEKSISRFRKDCDAIEVASYVVDGNDTTDNVIQQLTAALQPLESRTDTHRVLVIDDDDRFRRFLVDGLGSAQLNLDIQTASDGLEGCVEFGKFSPDLVLLDLAMPGLDGTQVLRRLHNDPQTPDARFMIISANTERFEELSKLGADVCLPKPVSIRTVIKEASRLLGIGNNKDVQQIETQDASTTHTKLQEQTCPT